MKRLFCVAAIILLAILALAFSACTKAGGDGSETAVPGDNTAESLADTSAETTVEETTEEETTVSPENIPTANTYMTFHTDEKFSDYISGDGCALEVVTDSDAGTVLKAVGNQNDARITFEVAKYLAAHNLPALDGGECTYLVVNMKVSGVDNGRFVLNTVKQEGQKKVNVKNITEYDASAAGWQQVILSPETAAGSALENIVFTPMRTAGGTAYIESIAVYTNIADMADKVERLSAYKLGGKSSLTVTASDPVEHVKINAPDEDSSVKIRFDHITEKRNLNDSAWKENFGYTMRVAKNEIQSCSFYIAPEADRSFYVTLSDFETEDGIKLNTSLYFMFYHNVNGVYMPDAIPPLGADRQVAVTAGNSQGFVIKAQTDKDTVAGLYKATVNVIDAATGKTVKTAEVYTKVWNFTLSDETSAEVVTGLSAYSIYPCYENANEKINQLYINYYDFLLENRVMGYSLPVGFDNPLIYDYMNNPRVRRFKLDIGVNAAGSAYEILSQNEEWLKKAYFYLVDEPTDKTKMDSLMSVGNSLSQSYPGYHMVSPFFTDITYNGEDQITSMASVTDIWCTKPFSFTPRELSYLSGTQYVQTEKQDEKYGTFAERMKKEQEGGDTVWTYVCWEPEEPYANWMINNDGTQTVVSMWQCKMLGVNGMLYWSCCYWDTTNLCGYGNLVTAPNGSTPVWGDGVLIYPGSPFGLDTAVSSLRLEGVRDGIEDYEYLTMIEKLAGKEVMDEYINLITTSVVTFTQDDDRIAAVRAMLGDKLEELINK